MLKRIISVILLFIFLTSFWGCRENIEEQRKLVRSNPFEKAKWFGLESDGNKDVGVKWDYRPGMARYLVDKNILLGKTRLEIIDLLGESEISSESLNKLNYELIQIYGNNIDPIAAEELEITFNQEEKVEKAEIIFRKFSDWYN